MRLSYRLVLLAFAVRLAFMMTIGTYEFKGADDYCRWGETTSIATSISQGHGFSSPFGGTTGPSAWIAPVYPYLLAGIFKLFGELTTHSIVVIFILQALLSALTIIPILGIAKRTVGTRAGKFAALAWAVFPWFSKWSVTWIWEVTLSALLLSLIFWWALCLNGNSPLRHWAAFGTLEGFALLTNPALLTLPPIIFLWHLRKRWRQPMLAGITCLVIISPWLIRNRVVFHQWVFLRSNFGVELALGNHEHSLGRGDSLRHPAYNTNEYATYQRMGEVAYVKTRQAEALRYIKARPLEFAELSAKRVAYFWDGSAMGYRRAVAPYWLPMTFGAFSLMVLPGLWAAFHDRIYERELYLGVLLIYPLPYYLTYSQVRYRHVIEPLMLLLVCYAAVVAWEKIARKL